MIIKNVLKIGFGLLIVMIALFSCENKDTVIQEEQDISEMAKDEVFINLVKNNANVINQISNIERAKELTSKDYDLSNEELNELSVSLGFADLNAYKKFYKGQRKSLIELNKKYNLESYDDFIIQELILESGALELERFSNKSQSIRGLNSLRLKTNNPESDHSDYESDQSDCETIRLSCIAIVASIAVRGHLLCIPLDVAVLSGLACHGAVVVAQVNESAICNATARICERNERREIERERREIERERREIERERREIEQERREIERERREIERERQ